MISLAGRKKERWTLNISILAHGEHNFFSELYGNRRETPIANRYCIIAHMFRT